MQKRCPTSLLRHPAGCPKCCAATEPLAWGRTLGVPLLRAAGFLAALMPLARHKEAPNPAASTGQSDSGCARASPALPCHTAPGLQPGCPRGPAGAMSLTQAQPCPARPPGRVQQSFGPWHSVTAQQSPVSEELELPGATPSSVGPRGAGTKQTTFATCFVFHHYI